MDIATEIREKLGPDWIPEIYASIREGRTRSYRVEIPERENQVEILHTLLGIELKVGKMRLSCPDLSTARFLRVFARIGCRDVAIPYNITEIPGMADKLDSAWHRTLLLFEELATGAASPQVRGKMRSALIKSIREEINSLGAGELMPKFDRITRQRSG
jgi:hypothetical protein